MAAHSTMKLPAMPIRKPLIVSSNNIIEDVRVHKPTYAEQCLNALTHRSTSELHIKHRIGKQYTQSNTKINESLSSQNVPKFSQTANNQSKPWRRATSHSRSSNKNQYKSNEHETVQGRLEDNERNGQTFIHSLKRGQSASDLSICSFKKGNYKKNKERGKYDIRSRYGSQLNLSATKSITPELVLQFAPKLPKPTVNLKPSGWKKIAQDTGFIDDELDRYFSELNIQELSEEPLFIDESDQLGTGNINLFVNNGSTSVLDISELFKKLQDPGMIIKKDNYLNSRRLSSCSSLEDINFNNHDEVTISTLSDHKLKFDKGKDNLFWDFTC